MNRKYDLPAMLKEIEDDEETGTDRKIHRQLTQPEIRRVFAKKKSKKGATQR
jgi:hypothetical protein